MTDAAPLPAEALETAGAAVQRMFPSVVHTAVAGVPGATSRDPIEIGAMVNASTVRREEFFAGRSCAHHVLSVLGEAGTPVGVGTSREPLWPAGIVGSITHTRWLAAAVAARTVDVWGLGIDAEATGTPLDAGMRRLVFTPSEIHNLAADEQAEPEAALVMFSAKESLFKCVHPRTGWRMDFQDVEIHLDLARRSFAAVVASRFWPGGSVPARALEGAFVIAAGHVLTGIAL